MNATMLEAEMFLPVRCPVCHQQDFAGFRVGVITEAFQSGQLRLYANCHLAGWDATQLELAQIREYLDDELSSAVADACLGIDRQLTVAGDPVFVHTGAYRPTPRQADSQTAN